MPALSADAPLYYYSIPQQERNARCQLTEDTCVVDGQFYFIRGNIEIAVNSLDTPFMWGVWVSLSHHNFEEFVAYSKGELRIPPEPWFGWLSAGFLVYPDCENLKTYAHARPGDLRPLIELEPTDHPLAVEQRNGITQDRLTEILSVYLHRKT